MRSRAAIGHGNPGGEEAGGSLQPLGSVNVRLEVYLDKGSPGPQVTSAGETSILSAAHGRLKQNVNNKIKKKIKGNAGGRSILSFSFLRYGKIKLSLYHWLLSWLEEPGSDKQEMSPSVTQMDREFAAW